MWKREEKSKPQSVKTGDPSQMKKVDDDRISRKCGIDSDASDLNSKKGKKGTKKRLSGVEPPHMPPEGIALSTELQTHSDCMMKFINNLIYPTIK